MDIGYAGAFLGGLLTLLSPCSVMLLPAFFAYAFTSPTALIGRTMVFFLGLAATLVPLGVFSASLGSLITTRRSSLVLGAAIVIIILGLWQLSGLPFPGRARTHQGDTTSIASVFVLGAVYAVAGVCAGPILGSVLMVAAVGGDTLYGGIMLAIFALGMTLPLFGLAAVWKQLGARSKALLRPREITLGPWRNTWTMVVAGVLSIAIGVFLILTDGTASLGGVFSIGSQYSAESSLATWSQGVSDLWFIVAAVIVLAAVFGWISLRSKDPDNPHAAAAQEK